MHINDLKYAGLAGLGYSVGALDDRELAWLIGEGATSGQINDAYLEVLAGLGFTGTLNDALYAYLIDAGYTGALDDMVYAWWTDGGGFGPQPAKMVVASTGIDASGAKIVITFDKAVTGDGNVGFTLRVNGLIAAVTAYGPVVGLTSWTVSLATVTVQAGQTVTLQYDDVAGTLNTDENLLDVVSFGPTLVQNNSAVAGGPVFVSANVDAAGTTLTAIWDENLTGDPDLGFSLKDHILTGGIIAGAQVTWTTDQVFTGEVLTLAYDDGTGDMAGVNPMTSFTNAPVTNNSAVQTAAVFSSGVVAASGLSVTITMNKNINGDPNLGTSMATAPDLAAIYGSSGPVLTKPAGVNYGSSGPVIGGA